MTSKEGVRCYVLAIAALTATQVMASGTLIYSATNFTERWQNDGGIGTTITVTLTNQDDSFSGTNGQDFVAAGWVTPTNVPSGLAAVVARSATNRVVISLAGLAATHTSGDSIANVSFNFLDAAFRNGPASSVTGASGTNLTVSFLAQNSSNWYVNAATGNDGTGDGLTPGSAWRTLTNALKKVQTAANDVLNLAPGTYANNGTVVDRVVTIVGDSRDNTILQPPPGQAKGILVPTTNLVLRSLTLQKGTNTHGGAVAMSGAVELYVDSCRFASNRATETRYDWGGGAISHRDAGGLVNLANTEFIGNWSVSVGGALQAAQAGPTPLIVSNCVFMANAAKHGTTGGGAIRIGASSSAAIYDSTFVSNSAVCAGGAIDGYSPQTVERCTFVGNSAGLAGGAINFYVIGASIRNSTFVGNSSATEGGAICYPSVSGAQALSCYNSTFMGNSAPTGGAIRLRTTVNLYSCIVASNTATHTAPDISAGTTVTASFSLIGDNAGAYALISKGMVTNAAGSYVGTNTAPLNPMLLPLGWNGGKTLTCALEPDSLAVDHGSNPLGLTTDQRGPGYVRAYRKLPDIGAFEYGASLPVKGTTIFLH